MIETRSHANRPGTIGQRLAHNEVMMKPAILLAALLGVALPVSAQTITWSGPKLTAEDAARVLSQCACASNVAPPLPAGTLPGVSGGGGTLTPQATTFFANVPMALPLRLDGTPRYQPYIAVPFYGPGVVSSRGDDGRRGATGRTDSHRR